jgi:hypothetical protein
MEKVAHKRRRNQNIITHIIIYVSKQVTHSQILASTRYCCGLSVADRRDTKEVYRKEKRNNSTNNGNKIM